MGTGITSGMFMNYTSSVSIHQPVQGRGVARLKLRVLESPRTHITVSSRLGAGEVIYPLKMAIGCNKPLMLE